MINLYLSLFQKAKVPVKEYAYDEKKVANIQSHMVYSFFIGLNKILFIKVTNCSLCY